MAKVIVDKEEFAKAKADKHHKEMMETMYKVVDAVKSIKIPEDNFKVLTSLETAITKLSTKINEKSLISSEKTEDKKEDKIQKEIVDLLVKLTNTVKELNKPIEEKEPKEWEFKVIRNQHGFIQSVKVTNN